MYSLNNFYMNIVIWSYDHIFCFAKPYFVPSLWTFSPLLKQAQVQSHIYYGDDMKAYLRTCTTQYEEDRKQDRRSKYAVQLASSQLRGNSLKTSVCPAFVATLQPTIFNGSYSYLAQPLTLVGACTLLIMVSLCSFCRIPWHFDFLIYTFLCLRPYSLTALQLTILHGSGSCLVQLLTSVVA